jgi:NADPH:quinone reductase
MNDQFRAAVCTALTGPDAIQIVTVPRARLASGEVRVKIHAAGLNFPDLLMTRGGYQFHLDPPFIPGMEMAGIVIETANDVRDFKTGDRVYGGHKGGCFAEEIAIHETRLSRLPEALGFEEGASYRAGAITALHALIDRAQIEAGESLLVLGAAGGVGMAAVQLGAHLGAHVIGTGSSAEKRAAILNAGAAHALDPASPNLAADIKALTGGKGVDVVYDPVGGDLAITATRAIAWAGRYLVVGFASGTIPSFPANHAMIKGYSIIGLRAGESGRRDPVLAARNYQKLTEFANSGVMRPHISHRFSLDETAHALRAMDARLVIGRAVITPEICLS